MCTHINVQVMHVDVAVDDDVDDDAYERVPVHVKRADTCVCMSTWQESQSQSQSPETERHTEQEMAPAGKSPVLRSSVVASYLRRVAASPHSRAFLLNSGMNPKRWVKISRVLNPFAS